jgi:hypothetical protein
VFHDTFKRLDNCLPNSIFYEVFVKVNDNSRLSKGDIFYIFIIIILIAQIYGVQCGNLIHVYGV